MGAKGTKPPITSGVERLKGLVTEQGANLLKYSENVTQAPYSNKNIAVNNDSIQSPDFSDNADRIVPNNGAVGAYVAQSVYDVPYNSVYTFSTHIKPSQFQFVGLRVAALSSTGSVPEDSENAVVGDFTAIFNLSAGLRSSTIVHSSANIFDKYTFEAVTLPPRSLIGNYLLDTWPQGPRYSQPLTAFETPPEVVTGFRSGIKAATTSNTAQASGVYVVTKETLTQQEQDQINSTFFLRLSVAGSYGNLPVNQRLDGAFDSWLLIGPTPKGSYTELAGKVVTTSFWARASQPTKVFSESQVHADGEDVTSSMWTPTQQQVFDLTTEWQRFTHTRVFPTTAQVAQVAYNPDVTFASIAANPNNPTYTPLTASNSLPPLSSWNDQIDIKTQWGLASHRAHGNHPNRPAGFPGQALSEAALSAIVNSAITNGYYDIALPKFEVGDATDLDDNNWYRISVTGQPHTSITQAEAPAVDSVRAYIIPLSADTLSPLTQTYDGQSGMYVWGSQLEIKENPSFYISTTNTPVRELESYSADASNFISHSEDFTSTQVWKRTNIGVTAVSNMTSPIGLPGITKLTETTTSGQHYIYYDTIKADRRDDYTISVYAKAAERTRLRLSYDDEDSTIQPAVFNLTNGNVLSKGSFALVGTESLGGGWYRCYATLRYATINRNNLPTNLITIGPSDNNTGNSYTGISGRGIYIWGAQVVKRSQPGDYIFTDGTPFTNSKHYDYLTLDKVEPGPLLPYNLNFLTQSEDFNITPWTLNNGASAVRYTTGNTIQPVIPDFPEAPLSRVFELREGTAGGPEGYSAEQTVILKQDADVSYDGNWTFSIYARQPLETSPRNRFRIDLDGISNTGNVLGTTSVLFSLEPSTSGILVQPTSTGYVDSVKASITPVEQPGDWQAVNWFRLQLTGKFGVPVNQIIDGQGNILSTFDGDDVVFFAPETLITTDVVPIRRIRVRVAPANGDTLNDINYSGNVTKGIDIFAAQLEQGDQVTQYTRSTLNRGYSFNAEVTRTRLDKEYYFPVIAWGRDENTNFFVPDINYQNTRAFTGKDTLVFKNKNLGFNNPNPTFSFDISGSLFSTVATSLTSAIENIKTIPGTEDLQFIFGNTVTINAPLSVNNNYITGNLSAVTVFTTNVTALSTRRDIISIRGAEELPPNFTPNFYVQALTGLSAFNLTIDKNTIVGNRVTILTGASAFNINVLNNLTVPTSTVVTNVSASRIFGRISLDPSEGNLLAYNSNNELTVARDINIAFGIKPSDSWSTDDTSVTRSLTGKWDENHDLAPGIEVYKPYFQNLLGVYDYVVQRGLFGNELTIYLFEDVVCGESRPNNLTSNLYQSGKYPTLDQTAPDDPSPGGQTALRYSNVSPLCAIPNTGNPTKLRGLNGDFFAVQFYTTEWLGSNYPALTAAGLRGGFYNWYRRNTLGERLSGAGTIGCTHMTWSSEPRFKKQIFRGMHNIGPQVTNNPNYNYFTPLKPFNQASPKFIQRCYICNDPSLSFGQFGAGAGNPKAWIFANIGEPGTFLYNYYRASRWVFNPDNKYELYNLGLEIEHNTTDATPPLWSSGAFKAGNILISTKGRGRQVYGTATREDGFSATRAKNYYCGEYQIDPEFLKPSRWSLANKNFTTEWTNVRGATGPNYMPGFAIAHHGNYTPGTTAYNAMGYNPATGGIERGGQTVGDYGGGAAGSIFSKQYENAASVFMVDFDIEGREIGRNSQLQSSLILDGHFNFGSDTWEPSIWEAVRTTTTAYAGMVFRAPTLSADFYAADWLVPGQLPALEQHPQLPNQRIFTYRKDLGFIRNLTWFYPSGLSNFWPYNVHLTPWSYNFFDRPRSPVPAGTVYPHIVSVRYTQNIGTRSSRYYILSAEERVANVTGWLVPDWIELDPLKPYEPIWTSSLSSIQVFVNSCVEAAPLYTLNTETSTFTLNQILSSFNMLKSFDEPGIFRQVSPVNTALTSTLVYYTPARR